MRCRTPGVVRKRLESAYRIDANDRLIRRQRAFRHLAQRRGPMRTAQLTQCIGATLQLGDGRLRPKSAGVPVLSKPPRTVTG